MMLKTAVVVALLGLSGASDVQWCSDCKWGVNKVVSYAQSRGNSDICSAIVTEVESYSDDLCNSVDGCSSYVTNMCQLVLNKIESRAGAALSADGIDATAICTEVDMCGSSSSSAGDDDDEWRARRTASRGYAERFCEQECANYPHPTECQPACVRDMTSGAYKFRATVASKMEEDSHSNPTITLSNGASGNCIRDPQSRHFLCSVDHAPSTSLESTSPGSSSSSSNGLSAGASVAIIVGAVATVLVIAGIAFKAVAESKKAVASAGASELLVEEYATA
eukprot:CAMPEP_0182925250 /NCGR_PEP_ID=MMETSP0105_2-20130417/8791_1 /TAXON_ID=81532 ORGANISM="Acanthoeca-like sp., Strain 10tr" /NCGR_SAMPLE_ID=MMETSP0105_2 /ASSEMBLY_ACC=CAM_ASM_000205 /LENGTH=278 /DNA_ID=CAMNT_0025063087 /DNA_START=64 /DNA_END=900 /DNA_ORIENTATION=+